MENPATQTAYGPMLTVAIEQFIPKNQRLLEDELAIRFLPPGWRRVARLCQWAPARNLLFSIAERRWSGVWGIVLCRKRYLMDKLNQALDDGVGVVVILGAGLDTLAYRLPTLAMIPVYEIDLPENIAMKRDVLEHLYGKVPANLTQVVVDLNRDDLASALEAHGFPLERKSFIACEAVTQYLTEEGVRNTLRSLGRMNSGSQLVFTYIIQDFYRDTMHDGLGALYRDFRVKQPLWKFGLDPDKIGILLREYSWKEVEQVGSRELSERYVKPAGRTLSVMEVERIVHASKT
jgi:methyltransferase (TIGR00027 family)